MILQEGDTAEGDLLAVQPKKGLTLIWPSEWTHAHKGSVLHANDKYIITGWMHFPEKSRNP